MRLWSVSLVLRPACWAEMMLSDLSPLFWALVMWLLFSFILRIWSEETFSNVDTAGTKTQPLQLKYHPCGMIVDRRPPLALFRKGRWWSTAVKVNSSWGTVSSSVLSCHLWLLCYPWQQTSDLHGFNRNICCSLFCFLHFCSDCDRVCTLLHSPLLLWPFLWLIFYALPP